MKTKTVGVVVFPGSNCDQDCLYVLDEIVGFKTKAIWHKETNLEGIDALVLPGGFSYGDYLRAGSIARFSPIMNAVIQYANKGKFVIGICNGFQVLLECGLLPGGMLRNKSLSFNCSYVNLKVESFNSPFTRLYQENSSSTSKPIVRIPIAHGEGSYFADDETIQELKDKDQILVRYVNSSGEATEDSNPNGSVENIAGICNEGRNVFGLMPHPERASEQALGSVDGRMMFQSMMQSLN